MDDFGICTLLVKKHRGASVVCQDNTVINRGDLVGEIHLNNQMIVELIRAHGSNRAAIRVARLLKQSLGEISAAMQTRADFNQVKGVIGITLLHRGIIHGLGFDQQQLKSTIFSRLTKFYLRLLLAALHPEGNERIDRRKDLLIPMRLVHSRTTLINQFSGKC